LRGLNRRLTGTDDRQLLVHEVLYFAIAMTRAIRIHEFGGPDVLCIEDVQVGTPGPGQVRVAHRAVGLNMVDTYYRNGVYPLALPSVVTAVGNGVQDFELGQRVAYASPAPLDAYAEERLIDAKWLVKLPADIDDKTAAAMMLKGLTSWYLLKRSYPVRPGDWVLLYAAAGGVGLIAAQWAKQLGARIIGIVGTDEKRRLALEHGCEQVLVSRTDDVVARVRELTGGAGVAAVYDSVGKDTFLQSLDCLRTHGIMVSFGNSSGQVPPFAPVELQKRGSLYVTRPTLFDFIRVRADLEAGAAELIELVVRGRLRIEIHQEYALHDVASAHADLEQRRTTGCTVLIPA
jgi:NADPH2:quinone reductase